MSREHRYWVYILTNKGNTVLYIGVSDHVQRRLFEHRVGSSPGSFAWRFQCWKLIHLEEFQFIQDAVKRETQLKNWYRVWKEELINRSNPEWADLSKEWDYSGWFDPSKPPPGYYQQHLKENWGGPEDPA